MLSHLCQTAVRHIYVGMFLEYLFYSIHPCVYPSYNMIALITRVCNKSWKQTESLYFLIFLRLLICSNKSFRIIHITPNFAGNVMKIMLNICVDLKIIDIFTILNLALLPTPIPALGFEPRAALPLNHIPSPFCFKF